MDDFQVPLELESITKKCDDIDIEYSNPETGEVIVTLPRDVLDEMHQAGDKTLVEIAPLTHSLPFVWDFLKTPEQGAYMTISSEVIYIMYMGNTMFMGPMMLCLGTFWMYAFQTLSGRLRDITLGITWGMFICMYIVLFCVKPTRVIDTVILIVSWQYSAVFAIASLSAAIGHQAPIQLCSIIFLQSMIIVVYTYTQKRDISASLAFLLMLMITFIQWPIATFTYGHKNYISSVIVLVLGIIISIYHAFHIRYVTYHKTEEYFLSDQSRLNALKDLYTDGIHWILFGIRDLHFWLSDLRKNWCCIRCGGRIPANTDQKY